MSQTPVKDALLPESTIRSLKEIKNMVNACMQCGTCTASCPNSFAMDYNPRQIFRLMQLGFFRDVVESPTLWLCSSCYTCTLRCPRGVPVTRVMAALKRIVVETNGPGAAKKSAFYRTFMDNVRRNGRVQEFSLMMRYFLAMRDPLLPLGFTGVAMKLMRKGKLHMPNSAQKGKLEGMFRKAAEIEGQR